MEATADAWNFGDASSGSSILTYDGLGNKYTGGTSVVIMGEIVRSGFSGELEINVGTTATAQSFFEPATLIVRVMNDVTTINRFDVEWVTVRIMETTHGSSGIETSGPDYALSEDGPLFTDSPCVRRWKKIFILDGGSGSETAQVNLVDGYDSTVISGSAVNDPATPIHDALYVTDLNVETDAIVDTDDVHPSSRNIYYTGDVVVGTTTCTSFTTGVCADAFDGSTPIKLVPTLYGDFDASGEGDETVDTDRFNDAFAHALVIPTMTLW